MDRMTGTVLNELKKTKTKKKILLNNSCFYQSIKVAVLQQKVYAWRQHKWRCFEVACSKFEQTFVWLSFTYSSLILKYQIQVNNANKVCSKIDVLKTFFFVRIWTNICELDVLVLNGKLYKVKPDLDLGLQKSEPCA